MIRPDWESVIKQTIDFIRAHVANAGVDGVIIGLSGGIDSTVTAYLCKRAMNENCLAMIMPNLEFTPDSETNDAIAVATQLAMKYKVMPITKMVNLLSTENTTAGLLINRSSQMKIALGNLNARIRAVVLYYEAQKNNYLVVGTDDKSEYLIGYFTKYGDGACDILPLADLYKTQVLELGRFLGVPQKIIEKSPGPYLWQNHIASTEIGIEYNIIDKILYAKNNNYSMDRIAEELNIPLAIVKQIETLHIRSGHKRKPPPIAKLQYGK